MKSSGTSSESCSVCVIGTLGGLALYGITFCSIPYLAGYSGDPEITAAIGLGSMAAVVIVAGVVIGCLSIRGKSRYIHELVNKEDNNEIQ